MGYTDSGLWVYLNMVYTKDSHDDKTPEKKLPVEDKDYLKVLFLHLLACEKLAVPKSRQIMASWAIAAFATWVAHTNPHREILYQAQKEEDAHAMVSKGRKNTSAGRMDFILHRLPEWLQDPYIKDGVGNRVGELVFSPKPIDNAGVPIPWYGSTITAVPGGADQVRGKTPKFAALDECAFYPDLDEAVAALIPATNGGGRYALVSSVYAGSDFNKIVLESPSGGKPQEKRNLAVLRGLKIMGIKWPDGVRSWETPSGIVVLELHYSADPDKDPKNDNGAWIKKAVKGYVGGFESPKWRREMEIDYSAGGGDPVFPFLTSVYHPIFKPRIPVEEAKTKFRIYAGYDYGTNNPAAFVVWGFDKLGEPYALWELYEPCEDFNEHCDKIKACPYFQCIQEIVCDPSIHWKTQKGSKSGIETIAQRFFERGIRMNPGIRGSAEVIAVDFKSKYWQDPLNPRGFITEDCPCGMKEVMELKHDVALSTSAANRRNAPETIMDKNNHWWDATAYLFNSNPRPFVPAEKMEEWSAIHNIIKRAQMKSIPRQTRPGIVTI